MSDKRKQATEPIPEDVSNGVVYWFLGAIVLALFLVACGAFMIFFDIHRIEYAALWVLSLFLVPYLAGWAIYQWIRTPPAF